jgi:hypothetical protein
MDTPTATHTALDIAVTDIRPTHRDTANCRQAIIRLANRRRLTTSQVQDLLLADLHTAGRTAAHLISRNPARHCLVIHSPITRPTSDSHHMMTAGGAADALTLSEADALRICTASILVMQERD